MMKQIVRGLLLLAGLVLGNAAQAGKVTYVYTDIQGTPVMESDAQGNITARFDYTPYGMPVQGLSGSPNGPGYTGHVNDPDTGFVYMQARYYDPGVGRFLSVDPIQGVGRYQYANNNPLRFIDPDGRSADERHDNCDAECNRQRQHQREVEQSSVYGSVWSGSSEDAALSATEAAAVSPWSKAMVTSGGLLADDETGVGVADDLLIPVVLIGAGIVDLNTRTFMTYVMTGADGKVYIGRTSGFGAPENILKSRMSGHHMTFLGFGGARIDKISRGPGAYAAVRGREQQLIDFYGGVGSSGVANSIRGVAKLNPFGYNYWNASNVAFGPLAPYTGGF